MERYEKVKPKTIALSSEGFYAGLSSEKGFNSSSFCSRVVIPTLTDFVCDVEITAKDVLTDYEYKFFHSIFIDQEEISDMIKSTDKFKRMEEHIVLQVGRAFMARKIFPTATYFRSKDLR